jgi:RNA exonuclease 1
VNHKLQSIYETLVKPHQKVLDYNTRWSGITEQHLQDCRVTIEDVQRRLLKLFSNKSILIGHSLESDLKALKVRRHSTFSPFFLIIELSLDGA